MRELVKKLDMVTDNRQKKKVRHKMSDIIALVFFATLSNADEWVSIEIFGNEHEEFLQEYLELPGGIPSHDTIQRVIGMVSPEFLEGFKHRWNEMMSSAEGEKIQKLLSIDGKTQRGNGNRNQKANHIVSAVDENGFSIGEKLVDDKSNEITAIPELLNSLNIKGHIITADAMGTQTEIVKLIRGKRADYVLALKGNQGTLHDDVKLFFDDPELLDKCAYKETIEKAHNGIERREYWHTDSISSWLTQKRDWAGLKSIAMTKNTITTADGVTTEVRYFISSLTPDVDLVARAIRGHWMVESYHWHLDVTFHEDDNRTIDKQASYNLNIIRKLSLHVLKIYDIGTKPMSMRMKRFSIGTNPERHLRSIMSL